MSQWKTIFGQQEKKKREKGLIFRYCFPLIFFFWKTTLFLSKLNKENYEIVFQLI